MRASSASKANGPVPKRSDQRDPSANSGKIIEKVQAFGVVKQPKLGLDGEIHPIITDFWNSTSESAQSRYYEASDWQYLRVALHFLNRLLITSKPSAQMLTVVNQMLTDLLVSEGSRRRVRMEIEREQAKSNVVNISDYFRDLANKNDLGDMFNY